MFHRDLDYTFEFTFDDLFKQYNNNKVLFLIVLPLYSNNKWVFGSIFLKKYELFFNPDTKLIHMYVHNNNKEQKSSINYSAIYIIVNIAVVFLFLVIGYFIGKAIHRKRRIKAMELEDNYDYQPKNDYQSIQLNKI